MILLDEVLGMDIQDSHSNKDIFEDHQDRVLRVSLLNSEGNCDFSRITCFQELDGHFVKVHEYRYPEEAFTKKDMCIWMDYEHYEFFDIDVEGFCLGSYIDWDHWEPIFAQDRRIPLEQKRDCAHLPEWLSCPRIYMSAGGYDYRHLYASWKRLMKCIRATGLTREKSWRNITMKRTMIIGGRIVPRPYVSWKT